MDRLSRKVGVIPQDVRQGGIYSAAGALWFSRNGQIVLTHTGQMFLGLAFYIVLILGAIAYAMHL
jgi:hypothetical protein